MKTNVLEKKEKLTAQGNVASNINDYQALRRSVMACLLWEDSYYESGVSIADRIKGLVPKVKPEKVAALAVEARTKMKLRHVPLLLVREMCRCSVTPPALIGDTLAQVIQRADEIAEFLSIYWQYGKCPVSHQARRGLRLAFDKFDEFALARYDVAGKVKLRDALFICHAKPKDEAQDALWKRLIAGKLATPDTWEVALSATKGENKKEEWERLLKEGKLGALALLRNLRNMTEAKVDPKLVQAGIGGIKSDKVLPFRFITAAKYAPEYESFLEGKMLNTLHGQQKLPGRTVLVIDVSGSMTRGKVSGGSELTRVDAASALTILARELCEEPILYATGGNDVTKIHSTCRLPDRHGFGLRDAIMRDLHELGGGGIFLVQCLEHIQKETGPVDRVIVFTDEQDCDDKYNSKCNPSNAPAFGKHNYIVNISIEQNGIAYDKFTHINGWSEAILYYIRESESDQVAQQVS